MEARNLVFIGPHVNGSILNARVVGQIGSPHGIGVAARVDGGRLRRELEVSVCAVDKERGRGDTTIHAVLHTIRGAGVSNHSARDEHEIASVVIPGNAVVKRATIVEIGSSSIKVACGIPAQGTVVERAAVLQVGTAPALIRRVVQQQAVVQGAARLEKYPTAPQGQVIAQDAFGNHRTGGDPNSAAGLIGFGVARGLGVAVGDGESRQRTFGY